MKPRKPRKKSSWARGEELPYSKLTEAQVRFIRARFKGHSRTHGAKAFSKRFGVHVNTIHKVIENKTWRHLS